MRRVKTVRGPAPAEAALLPTGDEASPAPDESGSGGGEAPERSHPSFRVRSAELEALLLGAPCTLTRDEVHALAGVSEGDARAIWGALGFPEVGDDERAFTRLDVEALVTARELREANVVDADGLLVLARTMGQGLARLAEAQVEVFASQAGALDADELLDVAADSAAHVVTPLEQLMVHVWRRQFAAASARALASISPEGYPELVVGFVDLVEYTRRTQEWGAGELEATLERFERDVSLRVAAVGGRVVKTLGDAVLFTTERAEDALEVALETVEAHRESEQLPDVRAGLACGPVLVRLGDVFGAPVNLASRLTSEARPNSVLVDTQLAAVVAEEERYVCKRLRKRSVRGYRTLVPTLVRRAGES